MGSLRRTGPSESHTVGQREHDGRAAAAAGPRPGPGGIRGTIESVMVVLSVVVVLVAGAVAALAVGRFGAGLSVAMPEPVHTTGHDVWGPGELSRGDVAAVRFDRAVRGYRMDQVDALLDRLADELAARDELIAQLRHGADQDRGASLWGRAPESTEPEPSEPTEPEPSEPTEPEPAPKPTAPVPETDGPDS